MTDNVRSKANARTMYKDLSVETLASFGTIMSLLTLGALIGNIICFRMTWNLLKSKPSLALVLNLNMSDIIVALISWSAFMLQHLAAYAEIDIGVIVHKLIWSLLVGLGNVTLLTLTGLAGDCFIALRCPLQYKRMVTTRTINIYITLIWISSALFGGSDFIAALVRMKKTNSYKDAIRDTIVFTGRDSFLDILTASITMLLSNGLSFICLVTMVVMYGYILNKIKQIQSNKALTEVKQVGLKRDIRAVRTTLMIFTSFLLLWLPTLIVNIVSMAIPNFLSRLSHTEAAILGYSADALLMVHSMVDAVIYGTRVRKTIQRHQQSRKSQKDFLRASTKRTVSVTDSDRSPNHKFNGREVNGDIRPRSNSTSCSSRRNDTLNTISETLDEQNTHRKNLSLPNIYMYKSGGKARSIGVDNRSFSIDESADYKFSSKESVFTSRDSSPVNGSVHSSDSKARDPPATENVVKRLIRKHFPPKPEAKPSSVKQSILDSIATSIYLTAGVSVATNAPNGSSTRNQNGLPQKSDNHKSSHFLAVSDTQPKRSSLKRAGSCNSSKDSLHSVRFSFREENDSDCSLNETIPPPHVSNSTAVRDDPVAIGECIEIIGQPTIIVEDVDVDEELSDIPGDSSNTDTMFQFQNNGFAKNELLVDSNSYNIEELELSYLSSTNIKLETKLSATYDSISISSESSNQSCTLCTRM